MGYRLWKVLDVIIRAELCIHMFHTQWIGTRLVGYFDETDLRNEGVGCENRRRGEPPPNTVVADRQTAGKGGGEKVWVLPVGNRHMDEHWCLCRPCCLP